MGESGNQLSNVLFQIILSQVAISISIIQTDMNSGLEEIVFPDNGVEKWLHVDTAILISIELQECWGTKEMPEL